MDVSQNFRISLRWPIQIINSVDKTKLSCNTPHRLSTTVSLETYPLSQRAGCFTKQWHFISEVKHVSDRSCESVQLKVLPEIFFAKT